MSANLLDQDKLFEIGFNVFAVGKTPRKHYMNGSLGH